MRKLIRDNRGGSVVEFSLLSLPVVVFMVGIMQTGWLLWADNLLNVAVDTAARCGAVGSTTSPCNGPALVTTAQQRARKGGPEVSTLG